MKTTLENYLVDFKGSLPVWDGAEVISRMNVSDQMVGGWLMQMGPQRMAAVLVDSGQGQRERDVKANVALPSGLRVQRVLDIQGREIQTLQGDEKGLEFSVSKFKTGAVIFIELLKPAGLIDAF